MLKVEGVTCSDCLKNSQSSFLQPGFEALQKHAHIALDPVTLGSRRRVITGHIETEYTLKDQQEARRLALCGFEADHLNGVNIRRWLTNLKNRLVPLQYLQP